MIDFLTYYIFPSFTQLAVQIAIKFHEQCEKIREALSFDIVQLTVFYIRYSSFFLPQIHHL